MPKVVSFMVNAPSQFKWLINVSTLAQRCRYGWGRSSHCLQFTLKGAHHTRRPDIILFVNDLPLALIELKNPADLNALHSMQCAKVEGHLFHFKPKHERSPCRSPPSFSWAKR